MVLAYDWVVAPALYTEMFEQLVGIELTERKGFKYKVGTNFRRGLTMGALGASSCPRSVITDKFIKPVGEISD